MLAELADDLLEDGEQEAVLALEGSIEGLDGDTGLLRELLRGEGPALALDETTSSSDELPRLLDAPLAGALDLLGTVDDALDPTRLTVVAVKVAWFRARHGSGACSHHLGSEL